MPETTASSSTISGGVWTIREDGRSAGASARSSARARRKRLRRTSQPCPAPPPSSVADMMPPLEVQAQLANPERRKRQCEGQHVIEQPEDQKTGKQILGIILPQRDQHGRVEHTEPAGRMAGKAEQRRGDENHR